MAAEFPGGSTQGNLTGIGSSAEAESTAVSSLQHSHLSYCPALPDNQKGDTRFPPPYHISSARLPLTTPDSQGPVTWFLMGTQATGVQQGTLQKQMRKGPPESPPNLEHGF